MTILATSARVSFTRMNNQEISVFFPVFLQLLISDFHSFEEDDHSNTAQLYSLWPIGISTYLSLEGKYLIVGF